MQIKYSKELIMESLIRYCSLLQCEILLLNNAGTIILSRDRGRIGAMLFFAPLEQCLNQVIQTESSTDRWMAPFLYCLPVNVHGSPVFYLAMNAYDSSRIARDCSLVAQSFSEQLIYANSMRTTPIVSPDVDLQTELIACLLSEHPQEVHTQVLLDSLGLDKSLMRAIICIEFSFGRTSYFVQTNEIAYDPMVEELRRDIIRFIREYRLFNRQDISTIYRQNELVIVKSFMPTKKIAKVYQALETICNNLRDNLKGFCLLEMKMAHGNVVQAIHNIGDSYSQAKEFLEIGRKQLPYLSYYNNDVLMLDLISKTLHPQIMEKTIRPILEKLRDKNFDINEELLCCAETLIGCCFSYSAASQRMSLHRNTIHIRMERFCSLTGLDPLHNFEDALVVKLAAVSLRQLHSKHVEE